LLEPFDSGQVSYEVVREFLLPNHTSRW